jgi:Ca-activated chloride channel family protein
VAALPADAGAHFDRGAALYALSRFDEAGQEFLRATEAKDGSLKASAFYNLGNTFAKQKKFKEAIEAYRRALTLDPKDNRAKWNLELALKQQKDEEKKKENDKNKDDKNKDKNKDDKKDQDKKDDKKDQDKKDDKKDQDKKDQDKKDQDKKDQDQKKQDQDKKDQPQPQDNKPEDQKPADQREIESVLDNLERSPADLEKMRAQKRAVRRRPPAKDW